MFYEYRKRGQKWRGNGRERKGADLRLLLYSLSCLQSLVSAFVILFAGFVLFVGFCLFLFVVPKVVDCCLSLFVVVCCCLLLFVVVCCLLLLVVEDKRIT